MAFLSKALSQMVHLWSYRRTMPPRACVRLVHVGCPNHNFSIQKCSRAPPSQPLYAPDPHFCRACTGANSSADFYSTVKAALRHERADSEEDCKDLGCDLVQGLINTRLYSHLRLKLIAELCGELIMWESVNNWLYVVNVWKKIYFSALCPRNFAFTHKCCIQWHFFL